MITKETLETNLQRIHEWIKAADQKVSIFLAFQGIVATLLFSDIFSWIKRSAIEMSRVSIVLFIAAVVLVCFSFYKSAIAIIPRLKNHKGKKSITYFGDIASMGLDHFRKSVKEISKEDYEEELISQIHISSKITVKKHSQFHDAVTMFFVGIGMLILIFIFFKIYGY